MDAPRPVALYNAHMPRVSTKPITASVVFATTTKAAGTGG